jgi:hypothetical protein
MPPARPERFRKRLLELARHRVTADDVLIVDVGGRGR